MKKIICLLFSVIFILFCVAPAFADDNSADAINTEIKSQWNIDLSCIYDSSRSIITCNGTVPYDLSKAYKNHTVYLYKLSLGQSISDLGDNSMTEPIATTTMSIKLHFTVEVESIIDVFSRYAVVFVSPEGSLDYISEAVFPSVSTSFSLSAGVKSCFKGIDMSSDLSSITASPSLVVLDIDIEKMYTQESMGYLYTFNDSSLFFSKSFIDELDLKLKTLSVSGASVYLRILSRDENGELAITDCRDEENLRILYAVCDFLSNRYDSPQSGEFEGVIIGRSLDIIADSDSDTEDIESYIERLALYSIVVTNAVRENNPSASIVLPISDKGIYSSQTLSGKTVIESICDYFDNYYGADLDFLLMLETDCTPLGITTENIGEGIDLSAKTDDGRITPDNIADLSKYVSDLQLRYSSSPVSILYYWRVDKGLSGNALNCAYAYAYYKLFWESKVNGFIIGFEQDYNASGAFDDLLNVFKYIDTSRGSYHTKKLLDYFGDDDWAHIIPSYSEVGVSVREHCVAKNSEEVPSDVIGEYYYFDYSERTGTTPWYAGIGAKSVSIDYGSSVGRALRVDFNSNDNTEYTYLLCKDTYPENYEFTPYVAFNFAVEGDGAEEKGLFEVKIELGNGTNVIESSTAVMSREPTRMVIDLSEFVDNHLVDYIKISVRPMSDKNKDYSIYLSSIVGYSAELDSEELGEAIKDSYLKIRNKDSGADGQALADGSWYIVVAAVVVSVFMGVMLFFLLRHDDMEDNND